MGLGIRWALDPDLVTVWFGFHFVRENIVKTGT